LPGGPWFCTKAAAALAAALCAAAASASVDTPSLPRHAKEPAGFVPDGWYAERLERADFDRDGRRDVLLLLRRNPEPGVADPAVRILAVALGTRTGYALAFENASLIPRLAPPYGEDPLANGELTLLRRGFKITLSSFAGVGSYAMANVGFTFRLRDGCFRLVMYERTEMNRATLDAVDTTVDYLKGRLPRNCIEDVGDAWKFQPAAHAR